MKKMIILSIFLLMLVGCKDKNKLKVQCMSNLKQVGLQYLDSGNPKVLKGTCPDCQKAYKVEKVKYDKIQGSDTKILTCTFHKKSLRADGSVK